MKSTEKLLQILWGIIMTPEYEINIEKSIVFIESNNETEAKGRKCQYNYYQNDKTPRNVLKKYVRSE